MLRVQRFIALSMSKPPRHQAIADRRRRRAMKKASITGDLSSYGAGDQSEEKPAVDLAPTQPPSILLPPDVPGRRDSDRMSPSLGTNAKVFSIENRGGGDVLTEARGNCFPKVGGKRKISRLQKAEGNLKRMKADVEKQRAERNQMRHELVEETTKLQAAAERIESALAQGWAQNQLMMVQNLQDQYLLMLGWRYILDADVSPRD